MEPSPLLISILLLIRPSLKVTAAAPTLAPIKALKSGASATPRASAYPLTGGTQTAEEITVQYQAAMARGAEVGRAQMGAGDTGRRGTEDTARPSAEEDAGRGSTKDTVLTPTNITTGNQR